MILLLAIVTSINKITMSLQNSPESTFYTLFIDFNYFPYFLNIISILFKFNVSNNYVNLTYEYVQIYV